MSEARNLIDMPGRGVGALAEAMREARDAGIALSRISDATGVNRALISQLCNHGVAALSADKADALWAWVDQRTAELSGEGAQIGPMPFAAGGLRKVELINTASFTGGLGMCEFVRRNRGIGILTGKPGVGKTTIVDTISGVWPGVLRLEAWPMMRLGDLLGDIAEGLGIRLSGSQVSRVRQIERAMKGKDIALVIDEAEMLRKWDNDKLEVLRKIWDHTGITLLLVGTPLLLTIVSRMNTTQLSRRMFSYQLEGATAKEMLEAMKAYHIEPEAARELARIAADTAHGGMGTWAMMMRLCLQHAGDGPVTPALVREAKQYKPGL